MALTLTSTAFKEGGRVPKQHTCDGLDRSPPLAWSGAPAGTKSFALVCEDPDAPVGIWYHWAVFDIPESANALPEGYPTNARDSRQAMNDFRRLGYGGPCPPHGHGTHRYRFTLYALKVGKLALSGQPHCRDVEKAARGQALAQLTLTGTYSR
jgi:hypothetical protein